MKLTVTSHRRAELIDITVDINRLVASAGTGPAACLVTVPHTTAAVTVNENTDPDVAVDLLAALERLVPWQAGYRHREGNSAAHIKASLMGSSLMLPVSRGRLALGTWQGVFFCEFDGPRTRSVRLDLLPGGTGASSMPPAPALDAVDRRLLNRIQSDFPIDPRPYRVVAEALDLTESEVLDRLVRLKATGIIRRIGGNFVPEKLGFVSTLCAARVPAERINAFAAAVNRHSGVTHNYLRDNPYNLWFTFIAPSRDDIDAHLADIAAETGIDDIMNLPATKVYKIRAHFDL